MRLRIFRRLRTGGRGAGRLPALALVLVIPTGATGQVLSAGPPKPPLKTGLELGWRWPALASTLSVPDPQGSGRDDPSATRVILTHAAVGTAAGLVIGLALSGASLSEDKTALVLTWTAVGLGAGTVAGVVSWLTRRGHDQSDLSASPRLPHHPRGTRP